MRAFTRKDLPEALARLITLTCRPSFDDAKASFDYRVRMYESVVYVGMLVGICYVRSKNVLYLMSVKTRSADCTGELSRR